MSKFYDVRARFKRKTYSLMVVPYDTEAEAIERRDQWRGELPYVEFWVEELDPNGTCENPPLPCDLLGAIRRSRHAEYVAQKIRAGVSEIDHMPVDYIGLRK